MNQVCSYSYTCEMQACVFCFNKINIYVVVWFFFFGLFFFKPVEIFQTGLKFFKPVYFFFGHLSIEKGKYLSTFLLIYSIPQLLYPFPQIPIKHEY